MIKYLTIFYLVLSSLLIAQDKYFIYFKDKGIDNKTSLNKTSVQYTEVLNKLSPHAIERRMKSMGDNIINYDDIPILQSYKDKLNALGINIVHELSWFNSLSTYLTQEQLMEVKALPFVKSIEPVKKLYFNNPEETFPVLSKINLGDSLIIYGNSFKQLNLSDVPIVHSKGIYGKDVIIGILDTGFDWKKHESLKNRKVIAEYDFIYGDSVTSNQEQDVSNQDDHGTFIFSLIAGYFDSVMIGPAFNSSFILAKTEDMGSETHIEEDNYAAALIWMESLGVDITTSSLGYNIFDSGYSYTYSDMNGKTAIVTIATELAFQRGVSTFAAAGNEGNNSWKYIIAPADGFNIIAVGAVNELGTRASFSSLGPTADGRIKPDVVAMGVNDFGAIAGTVDLYGYKNGTSAATPIASGVAALLLSAHPHLKNTQIRNIILNTSSNSENPNNLIGYGIISAKRAIEYPNLEFVNDNYVLHKIIFADRLNPDSVKISYSYDNVVIPETQMEQVNNYSFTFTLPQFISGKKIKFHITYSDSLNNNFRSPEIGEFEFVYGSDIISLNLKTQPTFSYNFISDFYPNPFLPQNHKTAKINFQSSANEIFNIAIIDASGQKVIEKNIITIAGENTFEWNGYSNQGILCASGVYYALIQLGGKEYGKKLVLLK